MQTYYQVVDTFTATDKICKEFDNIGICKDVALHIILPYLQEDEFYSEIKSFKVSPREVGYELNNMIDYYCPTSLRICTKKSITILSIFCIFFYIITHIVYNTAVLIWIIILVWFNISLVILNAMLWVLWILWCIVLWILLWIYYGCQYILCIKVNLENYDHIYQKLNCYPYFNKFKNWVLSIIAESNESYFLNITKICENPKSWCIYHRNFDQYHFHRNICIDLGDFLYSYGLKDVQNEVIRINKERRTGYPKCNDEKLYNILFDDVQYIKNIPVTNKTLINNYIQNDDPH
jgi:hypothetical protein